MRRTSTGHWLAVLLTGLLALSLIIGGCAKPAPPSPTPPAPTPSAPSLSPSPTPSPKPELPEVITITTLGVGSPRYTYCVGLRAAVEKYTSMNLRIESYDSDKARNAPLKSQESEFVINTGVNIWQVTQGLGDFAEWGPTPMRRVWNGKPFNAAMFARGDSGFKTLADLRGKRIPTSPASIPWSKNTEAAIAFGGLTLDDVKVVTVSSVVAGLSGVLEGTVDAVLGTAWGANEQELAASRHGIMWFDMPKDDTEGWERLRNVTPWAGAFTESFVGLKPGETITGAGYELGVWAMPWVADDVVYAFCQAVKNGYDLYAPMNPDMADWTWERAYTIEGFTDAPYHSGTVKFLKDMGVWTAEHEAFQQQALNLEKELAGK